jgi:hypothetical protein
MKFCETKHGNTIINHPQVITIFIGSSAQPGGVPLATTVLPGKGIPELKSEIL